MSKSTSTPDATATDAVVFTYPTPAEIAAARFPVTTYAAADRAAKSAIRSACDSAMRDAIASGDIESAAAYMSHGKSLVTTPNTRTETPVSVVIANRVRELRAAADMLAFGLVTPDGIDRSAYDSADVRAAASDMSNRPNADAVSRIASARIGRAAHTNNVADIIVSALTNVPFGTVLTVAQIAGTVPGLSDGAVAARLFPAAGRDMTVPNVTPVDGPPRGARLTVAVESTDTDV
jgi:hypothetical protein